MFVKKSVNFSNNKILFRCDGANISEIGTGHIYRCLTIARFLKNKFKLKYKNICFLVRSDSKYKIGLEILKKYNFKIIQIKYEKLKLSSLSEFKYFYKNPSNLVIIDRMGKINRDLVKKLDKVSNKKIIIDDSSLNRKYFDLSLNPMVQNIKKQKNSFIGYNYLILPIYFHKYKKNISKNNKVFIFFGGHDEKKLTPKIIKFLNKLDLNLTLFVSNLFKNGIDKKKIKNKIIFFQSNDYIKKLSLCNIAITAGGLGLFDNIVMNKKIICIPQYKHQEQNIRRIASKNVLNLLDSNDKKLEKKFTNIFMKLYNDNFLNNKIILNQRKISSINKIKKTLLMIGKIYAQSIN